MRWLCLGVVVRRPCLGVLAYVLCATAGCQVDYSMESVDWAAELPYWDPCFQFKAEGTCPSLCSWEHEGTSFDHSPLGCIHSYSRCESDADCNPCQRCAEFRLARCVPDGSGHACDGSYEIRGLCTPFEPEGLW